MSPEQVTGENPVDERTDIYALGCVLYEMLSGEPPFIGVTPEETIAQRLGHSPRRLSSVRKEIVPELDLTIGKALARNPSDRFRKASELGEALSASGLKSTSQEHPVPAETVGCGGGSGGGHDRRADAAFR